jgi:hypothetical protein
MQRLVRVDYEGVLFSVPNDALTACTIVDGRLLISLASFTGTICVSNSTADGSRGLPADAAGDFVTVAPNSTGRSARASKYLRGRDGAGGAVGARGDGGGGGTWDVAGTSCSVGDGACRHADEAEAFCSEAGTLLSLDDSVIVIDDEDSSLGSRSCSRSSSSTSSTSSTSGGGGVGGGSTSAGSTSTSTRSISTTSTSTSTSHGSSSRRHDLADGSDLQSDVDVAGGGIRRRGDCDNGCSTGNAETCSGDDLVVLVGGRRGQRSGAGGDSSGPSGNDAAIKKSTMLIPSEGRPRRPRVARSLKGCYRRVQVLDGAHNGLCLNASSRTQPHRVTRVESITLAANEVRVLQ